MSIRAYHTISFRIKIENFLSEKLEKREDVAFTTSTSFESFAAVKNQFLSESI